jgi:hypothetical protein
MSAPSFFVPATISSAANSQHHAAAAPRSATGSIASEHKQRLQRRVPHRVPCRVRIVEPESGETRTVVGETLNLSPNGLALQISANLRPGTWVETLVPNANGDPLFICGTVVHSRRMLSANFEIGVSMSDDVPPAFFGS